MLRTLHRRIKNQLAFYRFLAAKRAAKGIFKINVGSSGISEKGWIPSEHTFLNLLRPSDWERFFERGSVQNVFAEHVWEHLTAEEGRAAAQICFEFLKSGGRLRIAVPDRLHPDPNYYEYARPGGHGAGADDHKIFYDRHSLCSMLESVGFETDVLEGFDEQKNFTQKSWDAAHGFVRRSFKNDDRNADGKPNYTSLIVDAIKK